MVTKKTPTYLLCHHWTTSNKWSTTNSSVQISVYMIRSKIYFWTMTAFEPQSSGQIDKAQDMTNEERALH